MVYFLLLLFLTILHDNSMAGAFDGQLYTSFSSDGSSGNEIGNGFLMVNSSPLLLLTLVFGERRLVGAFIS
jgi:hypothetical protein